MNGPTENTAHGSSEKPEGRSAGISLATARSMLPLIRRIVEDIVENQRLLAKLLPEEELLHRQRRDLTWPERSRRYAIQQDIAGAQQTLVEAKAELAGLGLVLLDEETGRVGMPTLVNGRQAFFSWWRGEEDVRYWHFPGEATRRKIPASWAKEADMSFAEAKG